MIRPPDFGKRGRGALGREKNRSCGAFQTGLPILETGTEEGGGAVGACIVDQDIQTAKFLPDVQDHAIHFFRTGQIGTDDFRAGSLGTKLAGQTKSRLLSASMVKDEGVAQIGQFPGKKGPQPPRSTGDQSDAGWRFFHERIPRVRATARTLGISWVRRRSVLPRRARTAKSGSAERTSSWKNSKAWGRA